MNQQIKIIKIICVIIIGLALLMLITTFNNAITLKEENIKILESEIDDLCEQLVESNSKLEKYENMVNVVNNIDLNKNDYTYYDDIPLTIEEQEFTFDIATANNFSYELVLSILKLESNYEKELISDTNDFGIAQINKSFVSYWASLANLNNYDLFDLKDNLTLAMINLVTCRNYWLEKYPDMPDEVLIYYVLGSYNRGLSGFAKYCKENNTHITDYAQIILNHKVDLEQKIN